MAGEALGELVETLVEADFEGVSYSYDPQTKIYQIVRRGPWMELDNAYGFVTSLATAYDGSTTKIKYNGVEIAGYWRVKSTVEEDTDSRKGRIIQVAKKFNTSVTHDYIQNIEISQDDGEWMAVTRVWEFRDATTMLALIVKPVAEDPGPPLVPAVAGGAAVTDWDDSSGITGISTWSSAATIIQDHNDGSYTIKQRLVNDDSAFSVKVYWNDSLEETKVFTRSRDDQTKTITYTRWRVMRPSEKTAFTFLDSKQTGNDKIVNGSLNISKLDDFMYRGECLTLDPADIGAWA